MAKDGNKSPVGNGIVVKPDGRVVMLCGASEVPIRLLGTDGQPVKVGQERDKDE